MARLPETQDSRRGLLIDEHLRLLGADGVFAIGDCTGAFPLHVACCARTCIVLTRVLFAATSYAPTAQAASQQGIYLSRVFQQLTKKQKLLDELEQAKKDNADPARLDSLANAVIRASAIRPFHYSHQGVS